MNQKSSKFKIKHLVPNNPEVDRATKDPEEVAAERRAIKNTLYDSSYKTASGHWKRRDEPGEPRKTEYLKIAPDALRQQKQWIARQRLKRKNAVPTRQGKKLFDEFMREATAYRQPASTIELEDLKQVYLAARALDDFEKWIYFIVEVL